MNRILDKAEVVSLFKSGQRDDAIKECKKLLQTKSDFVDLWKLLAKMYYVDGQLRRAYDCLLDATKLFPSDNELVANMGVCCRELGQLDRAEKYFTVYTDLAPEDYKGWVNLSDVRHSLKKYSECVLACDRALNLNPHSADAHNNRGNALAELGLYLEAMNSFDLATNADPGFSLAWTNKGNLQLKLGLSKQALESCLEAIRLNPGHAETWNNLGNAQIEEKFLLESIKSFDNALNISPQFAQALNNKGVALHGLRRFDEALANYDRALMLDPTYEDCWNNRGNLLAELKRHGESAKSYLTALKFQNKPRFYRGKAHHQMMMECDWSNYILFKNQLDTAAANRLAEPEPFGYQGIANREELLLACAETYTEKFFPPYEKRYHGRKSVVSNKIKVGYLAGEFYNQATTHLMIGIWENHDSEKFEIFAFDNGPSDSSSYRARVEAAITNIIDIKTLSDQNCAQFISEMGVDILVNLNGFFGRGRSGVFARKPAPIAVNYLGFPGTMGASYIDYIVADKIVIPESSREFYTEKVVYLPDTYQANDGLRSVDSGVYRRVDFDLPERAFVFCCFNNTYKITPEIFGVWMDIIKAVDGSVIWLLEDNAAATRNLKALANAHAVDPARLVFAGRVDSSKHIARHRLADLFLDTLPYNAHTTASDALWAGLPMLTVRGSTFPGRVGASLLNGVGLAELIMDDVGQYRENAIRLGCCPEEILRLRRKLADNKRGSSLFDTVGRTRQLETAYFEMWSRHKMGLAPDHFSIGAP